MRAFVLGPHLVYPSSLFNRDPGVVTVLPGVVAHPAKGLPIFLTEHLKFLSMLHAAVFLGPLLVTLGCLFQVFYHVGYVPIGPEVSEQKALPAYRT